MLTGSFVALILTIAAIGVIAYFVEAYIPMSPPFKMAVRVLLVIFVILTLAQFFGILHGKTFRIQG